MSYARKGSKHRKHPEKSNSSEMDQRNSANGSVAFGSQGETTTMRTSVPSKAPIKVRVVSKTSRRKHMIKRCCRIGYRAAKRGLYCMVDRYYSAKYRNMEHYARQRFQGRKPSRATKRFMHHLDRYCIKLQLKSVFYKCCDDGMQIKLQNARSNREP
ncbi:hypothetical protein AWC38_SpisGene4058 [Stylophora pistillata]|uniref:Uncharacterized protein n=2 Tax=Stylophora pistillata TaxID=50429 RepID=A0A2B4SMI5_STYPI|nr:hypothetical protein AWC38_SpisGene4058 [Stylophora pistillata]